MRSTYAMVEMAKIFWAAPMEWSCDSGARFWRSPMGAWLPGSKEFGAALELGARLNKRYDRPQWGERSWGDGDVELSAGHETPFGTLINFKRPQSESRPKILLVAPMSGHFPTLLRDTCKELSRHCDVFITEWTNARDIPLARGDFSLDTYVEFISDCCRELRAQDGRPLTVVSVCQPTVPALAAASLMWEDADGGKPDALVMIGGPIDARLSPTAANNFATQHSLAWFEDNLLSIVPSNYRGVGRLVYPGFLQHLGFVAMNPSRHAKAHKEFFQDMIKGDHANAAKHRDFYDEYNAVMDLPASYYLQTIKKVFQDFDLPNGRLELCGRLVKPSAIKAPLLTLEGELDDISGSGQTHSAQKLCSAIPDGKRQQSTISGVGHYGIFSGTSFRRLVSPEIVAFAKAAKRLG